MISEAELAGLMLQPTEIKRVQLCTLAEAAALVTPLSHRRLTWPPASDRTEFAYLEDGTGVIISGDLRVSRSVFNVSLSPSQVAVASPLGASTGATWVTLIDSSLPAGLRSLAVPVACRG